MSNSKSVFGDFFKRINLGFTQRIFILFAILFVTISVFFYGVLARYQHDTSRQLIEKATYKTHLLDIKNQLESETQKSLNSSLLFNISDKEVDRFQTIYSLKASKTLFDRLQSATTPYAGHASVESSMDKLKLLLTTFDSNIAASINGDGKFAEWMQTKGNELPIEVADTLEEAAIEGEFLFEQQDITPTVDIADARVLEGLLGNIQNELLALENHLIIIINEEMATLAAKSPRAIYIAFSIVLVLLLVILGYYVSARVKTSITRLSSVLHSISMGELPDSKVNEGGEFASIVVASNQLVHYLDDASQFAVKIGDGDFNYEFKPKSKQDALGNSLIDMRNRLQQVAREDKIRNWMNEGQARFAEILRQQNDDLHNLGAHVISNLVEYLDASQGALFVVKGEDEDGYLELLSAYAYKRKKYIQKRIEKGEGLAGQAFAEGKTIFLTEINTDHYQIQTGLGESRPSCLLIVPLKEDDKIEGIIEIASLKMLDKHQREFVESIGESLASSLNAGKVNQTTKSLLAETQEKAEEMKAQEEELRQNMEELAATQEQMERRNKEMEEIQQRLSEERYLLNALLNSSNDRIYFKDKDSRFIRVSKSMVELFDKADESELQGKSDFDFGFGEHAKEAFEDEQRIIRTAKPMEDVVEAEKWDDGRLTWVSTTKNPLRDLDGNIIGTFGISRDVTSSKLVEMEMKKRKEWFDNFFNFYPAGFVVLNQHGKVSFASKGILSQMALDSAEGLSFEDLVENKTMEQFLLEIDFEKTKDQGVDIEVVMKGTYGKKSAMTAISGSKMSEDGTQHIFLIQK
ncbi:MAG: PAS domain-containing protein [Cyclobacteriaceae bacterium]|nr:PAS domain-containing protein [Cyclobacteriaceae bacterium]